MRVDLPQGTVFLDVKNERDYQDKKWGEQNHSPLIWMLILMEEVGESARALLEFYFRGKPLEDYRNEMIQVAAVGIAAIESLDRGNHK